MVEENEAEAPDNSPVGAPIDDPTDNLSVRWPPDSPTLTHYNDLSTPARLAYIAYRAHLKAEEQEQAEQQALNTVLDALATLLEESGLAIRTERNQPQPPPQTGTPSPITAFERPPGSRAPSKPSRKRKPKPPAD